MRTLTIAATLFVGLLTLNTLMGADSIAKKGAFTEVADAGPDYAIQGEYEGEAALNSGPKKFGAQVIARGNGKFDGRILTGGLPGAGWDGKTEIAVTGKLADGKVTLTGKDFSGEIANGKLTGKADKLDFALTRVERKSPTEGAKPPEGAVVLFDGSNLDHFAKGVVYESGKEKYLAAKGGPTSKDKFSNFTMHLEFRLPFQPEAGGQGRGNSGVYIAHHYECQVLDSFGLKGLNNECGGFYQQKAPDVNMCLPPLTWQTYDIDFTAAQYDGDKKTKNCIVTVKHNGVVIHDKVELTKETPGGVAGEKVPAALYLQDHGDPVVYRNIWVVEKK